MLGYHHLGLLQLLLDPKLIQRSLPQVLELPLFLLMVILQLSVELFQQRQLALLFLNLN